jgi:DNA sulfur modification protein DndD
MIFRRLFLGNFGIFRGYTELDLALQQDHPQRNIILIGGMNGRGKTTLLEAILTALYGRYSPAVKHSGLTYSEYLRKYTNQAGGNTRASVQLSFSVGEGKTQQDLSIQRSWDCGMARLGEKVQVWVDGVIDHHLSQNWYLFMEEILPAGVAGLFFFDGEKVSSIAEDLGGQYTRRAIDSLLGIDIIDRLVRDLTRIVTRNKKRLRSTALLEDTTGLETQRDKLLTDLVQRRTQYEGMVKQVAVLRLKLAEAEELFLKEGGTLGDAAEQLNELREALATRFVEAKARLLGLAAGPMPLNLVRPLLEKVRIQAEKEAESEVARHRNEYLKELSAKITKRLNGASSGVLQEVQEILWSEQESLAPKLGIDTTFHLSPMGAQQLSSLLNRSLESEVDVAKKFIDELSHLKEEMSKVDLLLSMEPDQEQVASRLADVKRVAYELRSAEDELEELGLEIETLQRELQVVESNLRRSIERILQQENEEDAVKRVIQYALTTIDTMSRFRKRLVDNKARELAECVMECFLSLTNKECLVGGLRLDPETYSLTMFRTDGDELLTSQLSTGERQMLAVSLLWGLGKGSGKRIPVVIDTPLARLDSSHRHNYVKHYLPHASHQVIVLSTDEEIVGKHLEMLKGSIASEYLLTFDEEHQVTRIVKGYFAGESDDR